MTSPVATSSVGECLAFYPLNPLNHPLNPPPQLNQTHTPKRSPAMRAAPPTAHSVRKSARVASKRKHGLKPRVLDFGLGVDFAPPDAEPISQAEYFDPFPMIPVVPAAQQYMAEFQQFPFLSPFGSYMSISYDQ